MRARSSRWAVSPSPRCASWRLDTGWRWRTSRIRRRFALFPGGDYKRFIDAYLEEQGEAVPDTAGELVSVGGESRGKHDGVHNFTVGQRKGLGLASPSPLYVISIDRDASR